MLMNSQDFIPNSDPLLNSKLYFQWIYSVSLFINPSYFTCLKWSIWSSPQMLASPTNFPSQRRQLCHASCQGQKPWNHPESCLSYPQPAPLQMLWSRLGQYASRILLPLSTLTAGPRSQPPPPFPRITAIPFQRLLQPSAFCPRWYLSHIRPSHSSAQSSPAAFCFIFFSLLKKIVIKGT